MKMYKKLDKKLIWTWTIIFFMVLLTYCMYLPAHYGTDGWAISWHYKKIDQMGTGRIAEILEEAVYSGFSSGRFTRGILFILISVLGNAELLNLWWMNFIAIVFFTFSAYIVWRTILDIDQNADICVLGCLLLAFCQPFFADWFQYTECQLFHSAGLFLAIYAARIAFMGKRSIIKRWIYAAVLLNVSCGLYQITMQWFVWMAMAIVICMAVSDAGNSTKDTLKKAMDQILYALSIYLSAAIVQLLFTMVLFQSPRLGNTKYSLAERISKVMGVQIDLWQMEPYTQNPASALFGVVCIVIFAIMLVSLFTRKQPFKMALTKTIILLTCTLGFYMSIFLPLTLTELWFPQRSVVGFWGIPMLLSLPVKTTVLYNKKMNFFLKIPNVIIVCMLVINIVTCHRFGRDLHRVNGMDILRTQEIERYINQYEKENNIVVQKLAFHYDADPLYVYPGIVNYHENNQAAWSAEWNPIALMCIVGEKEFEEIPFEEPLYLLHFEGKNWDVFSPEQILFDGDTAYILIY